MTIMVIEYDRPSSLSGDAIAFDCRLCGKDNNFYLPAAGSPPASHINERPAGSWSIFEKLRNHLRLRRTFIVAARRSVGRPA